MTHYAASHPKARKPHRCEMCSRLILPGENYRRSAGMDGSTAWTWIECAHCEAFIRLAYARNGWDDGYDQSLLGDFWPDSMAEARVLIQYRRDWRHRDGSLYPVPQVIFREDRHGFGFPISIQPGIAA